MAPSTSTAVRNVAPSRNHQEPGRGANRRPSLRVVPVRRRESARRRLLALLPVVMVVGALLAVVGGQAMLANGQVRLSALEQQLQIEQGVHRQLELHVSTLETPSRIVSAAVGQLHMVHPAHVTQLPYVSLSTALPAPTVTPPPASSSPSTTSTAGK
jgi:cell division protein FtsL